jgi:hypothetical protein
MRSIGRLRSSLRTRVALGVAAGLAILTTFQAPATAVSGTWTNPVISHDAADPYIYFDGTTYWAFTTNTQFTSGAPCNGLTGWVNVPVWTSTNLTSWTCQGDALPNSVMPSWVASSHTGLIWAPSLLKRVNIYSQTYWVLYFTAPSAAAGHGCIGAAVSYSLGGPYTGGSGSSPLECDTTFGVGYYDASPVTNSPDNSANPQAHLFWAAAPSNGTHYIYTDVLASNGYQRAGVAVQNVMGPAAASPNWHASMYEAPSVVWNGAVYVMFYAGGAWNGADYATGWATCTQNGFGVFTSCTDQSSSAAMMSRNSGVTAPGGAEVFTAATPGNSAQKWLVYHGYNYSACSANPCNPFGVYVDRQLRIDKLNWGAFGIPTTPGPTYTTQSF